MTEEKLKNANALQSEIEWCKDIRSHYSDRLILRFRTVRDCIESYTNFNCPEFLKDKIYDWVRDYENTLKEEFDKL